MSPEEFAEYFNDKGFLKNTLALAPAIRRKTVILAFDGEFYTNPDNN